jgi:hypothetical protein
VKAICRSSWSRELRVATSDKLRIEAADAAVRSLHIGVAFVRFASRFVEGKAVIAYAMPVSPSLRPSSKHEEANLLRGSRRLKQILVRLGPRFRSGCLVSLENRQPRAFDRCFDEVRRAEQEPFGKVGKDEPGATVRTEAASDPFEKSREEHAARVIDGPVERGRSVAGQPRGIADDQVGGAGRKGGIRFDLHDLDRSRQL